MEDRLRRFTLCILMMFSLTFAFAQEVPAADEMINEELEETDYELKETENGQIEFVQKFTWEEMEYVLKYEFTLEQWIEPQDEQPEKNSRKDKKEKQSVEEAEEPAAPHWEQIELIETKETEINLTLTAGKYRYKIAVYNLLGAVELITEWENVDIIKAYQPELKDVSPVLIYLEEPQTGIFTLEGIDLRENAKVYFLGKKSLFKINAEIIERDDKNKKMKVRVNPLLLDTQQYSVVIVNEGGLKSSFNPVTVKFKKPVDLDVSAGYSCPINVFDNTFKEFLKQRVWPLGVDAKISFMPFKHTWGYWGMGVSGSYTLMNKKINNYQINGNLINGYVTAVYQYPLRVATNQDNVTKHILTFEVHAGAGFTYFKDFVFKFPHDIVTEPLNSFNISAVAGGAVQMYISNRLFAEFNLDATYTLCSDMQMINVVPAINIGYQL